MLQKPGLQKKTLKIHMVPEIRYLPAPKKQAKDPFFRKNHHEFQGDKLAAKPPGTLSVGTPVHKRDPYHAHTPVGASYGSHIGMGGLTIRGETKLV